MSDIVNHLRIAVGSAEDASFEAAFAMRVSSPGALSITLATARDHFLRGLAEIDAAIAAVKTNGEPDEH